MSLFAPHFTLASLSEYRKTHTLRSTLIEEASVKRWRGPQFVNPDIAPEVPKSVNARQPRLEVIEHENATVMAACNFLLSDGFAIHPDCHDPVRDVTMSERFKIIKIKPEKGNLYYEPSLPPVSIDAAITLLHQSAGNYAHFMTEVLPKLLLIERLPQYRNMPIMVDKWIHANHIAAIRAFMRGKRDVIEVHQVQAATVKRLVDVSPPGHAPPDLRSHIENDIVEDVGPDAYEFSTTALNLVRDAALAMEDVGPSFGDRLFIYRRTQSYGNSRHCINNDKLVSIAKRLGFKIIETGSMTIKEQIGAFRDARIVVSPVGAALVNLMFARKGCRIVCLAPVFPGANYHYFARLMEALGHDLRYVIGPQVQSGVSTHLYHRDYSVPVDAFRRGLQWATGGSASRPKAPLSYGVGAGQAKSDIASHLLRLMDDARGRNLEPVKLRLSLSANKILRSDMSSGWKGKTWRGFEIVIEPGERVSFAIEALQENGRSVYLEGWADDLREKQQVTDSVVFMARHL